MRRQWFQAQSRQSLTIHLRCRKLHVGTTDCYKHEHMSHHFLVFILFFPTEVYEFFHFSHLVRKKTFWKLSCFQWPPLTLSYSFWTFLKSLFDRWYIFFRTSRTVSLSTLHCVFRDFTLLAVSLSDFEKQNSNVTLIFIVPFPLHTMTVLILSES